MLDPNQRLVVPSSYTIKDIEGTEYFFSLTWWYVDEQNKTTVPHYRLTQMQDRWGRTLTITPTSITDNSGRGISLSYTDGLLTGVTDPQGRTHVLSYDGGRHLAGVTLYGPGNPDRTVQQWSFTYTGDLVAQKTGPCGKVVTYTYGAGGAVASISWLDDRETPPVQRTITRAPDSDTVVRMVFPGNRTLRYTYQTGTNDLLSVADVDAGRTWSFTYDGRHSLRTVRSPLEQSTTSPFVQYDYAYTLTDGGYAATHVTARVRQANDTLGDPVEIYQNNYELPTEVRAVSRGVLPDQVTYLYYAGPASSLSQVIEAVGRPEQQQTDLLYDGPDGTWGLPTRVRNSVGAESMLDYHDDYGWLLSAASPENLVVPPGHNDRAASTTALQYNADGLPSLVTDPEGHQVAISYNAAAPGSPNLVVTLTFNDGSTRRVKLNACGKPVEAVDENGVVTQWVYNRQQQVKTIRRAVGTANETLTTFLYDSRCDMVGFDPPSGAGGRVTFDYMRYSPFGQPLQPPVYEGRVTHITYPDGNHEYFWYDSAGELTTAKTQAGMMAPGISITRDVLHRPTTISYPLNGSYPQFNVTTTYDEFGRVSSTTDLTGTTSVTYDSLDRVVTLTPPAPQKALTYTYTPDLNLKRWSTSAAVANLGTYTYGEDTKGRLAQVTNPFAQISLLEYDKDGKNRLLVHGNGTREERTYTDRDWLQEVLVRSSNGAAFDWFTYYYTDAQGTYDPTGHVRREIDAIGQVRAFSYDALYRLAQETHPDFTSIAYTYDPNGNRLTRTANGVTDYYGNDANNKLLWVNRTGNFAPTSGQANPYTVFSYDIAGRMTQRERRYDGGLLRTYQPQWDGASRLRAVKQGMPNVFTASYDGGGLRTSKWDTWTGQHDYSWGPGGVVYDSNATTTYTPGLSQRTSGTDNFVHPDWLGSTRWMSSSTGLAFTNGLRYDGYGQKTSQVGGWHPSNLLFAGGWGYQTEYGTDVEPGLGLMYLEQRYYDPAIGRFISRDPISFAGGLNLYGYCYGNPVGFVDPFGLAGWETGSYAGDVWRALQVEARTLNPVSWIHGAGALVDTARTQGAGAAGQALLSGVVQGYAGIWTGTDLETKAQSGAVWAVTLAPVGAKGLGAARTAGASGGRCTATAGRIGGFAPGVLPVRLGQSALEHIVLRHWHTSGYSNVGRFTAGTTARSLRGMIQDAGARGVRRPSFGGRTVIEHTFGSSIGVNRAGALTSQLRVVIDAAGDVVTAFPI